MHNKKKASAKAGQKLNHDHFHQFADALQQCLTRFTTCRHHLSPVLNTPQLAESAPVSLSGFFTSIGFYLPGILPVRFGQWPGSAQPYKSLWAKSASGLTAVLKYLAAPQQGVISTNQLGAIMANPKCTRLHTHSLAFHLVRFRALRRFIGPALAYRLAFAGRAA